MNLRAEIDNAFGPQAFARPLFYSWPGGLRFELSETGGMIEQFLTAMRKAITICGDISKGTHRLSHACAFIPVAIDSPTAALFAPFNLLESILHQRCASGAKK